MTETDELYYSAGQDAFELGCPQTACPYDRPGRDHDFWLAGWDEARRYAEQHVSASALPGAVLAPHGRA